MSFDTHGPPRQTTDQYMLITVKHALTMGTGQSDYSANVGLAAINPT